jgi:protein-disulfide isomerase
MVRSNRYWVVVLFAAAAGTSVPLTGQAAPDSMLHFRNLRIVGCGASGCLPLTAAQLQRPANASVSTDPNALPVADSPARGAAHPKVTLIEFADYTCPSRSRWSRSCARSSTNTPTRCGW